jgi:hypothetical protein
MRPHSQNTLLLAYLVPALAIVTCGTRLLARPIPQNSSVFIDPMDGFGPQLEKALLNDGVPLVIVSDKDDADFEIMGGIRDTPEPADEWLLSGSTRSGEQPADVRLIRAKIVNRKTKRMVWGFGVTGISDLPSAAEICAKQLKDEMKHQHQRH